MCAFKNKPWPPSSQGTLALALKRGDYLLPDFGTHLYRVRYVLETPDRTAIVLGLAWSGYGPKPDKAYVFYETQVPGKALMCHVTPQYLRQWKKDCQKAEDDAWPRKKAPARRRDGGEP